MKHKQSHCKINEVEVGAAGGRIGPAFLVDQEGALVERRGVIDIDQLPLPSTKHPLPSADFSPWLAA